jgi:hypothetical protein
VGASQSHSIAKPDPSGVILWHMKVEEIAEAAAGSTRPLPPLGFIAFEAGRTNHTAELDSTAVNLADRLAARLLN